MLALLSTKTSLFQSLCLKHFLTAQQLSPHFKRGEKSRVNFTGLYSIHFNLSFNTLICVNNLVLSTEYGSSSLKPDVCYDATRKVLALMAEFQISKTEDLNIRL